MGKHAQLPSGPCSSILEGAEAGPAEARHPDPDAIQIPSGSMTRADGGAACGVYSHGPAEALDCVLPLLLGTSCQGVISRVGIMGATLIPGALSDGKGMDGSPLGAKHGWLCWRTGRLAAPRVRASGSLLP